MKLTIITENDGGIVVDLSHQSSSTIENMNVL